MSVVHYNDKGRVDYVEDTAENRSEFGYDQETGRKNWEKNALGKYTRYSYNDLGLVTGVWGEATYPVSYEYDEYGQRTHMYTYKGGSGWNSETWSADIGSASATIWHYDDETGLLSAKEDAEGKQVLYSYTQTGQLQTRTWARQDGSGPLTTTYSYDANTAELRAIDYSDTTTDISFTYDRLGRQETVTDAVGTRTFGYRETLQLGAETITGLYNKSIIRSYDESDVPGRSTGFNIGTEYSVTYGYDPVTGRFNSVSWDTNEVTGNVHYGYLTDSDLLENVNYNSGQVVTYGYEPNRNLKTQVKNAFSSNLISQYDYTYDALGRRKNVKNSGSAFAAKRKKGVKSAFDLC